ncbi:MAG: class I SAM-dependent methyltransferase [Gammaproteobacteria bacterium]|nr:class I SAM-dependent methyltransferase [Gammaproteobacteria bacterium]
MNKIKNILKRMGVSEILVKKIRRFLSAIGIDLRMKTYDRYVLESIIFPYLIKNKKYKKIVFIGTDYYTRSYCKIFRNKEFYTLEYDKKQAKFGCKLHIVDSFTEIDSYFKESEVDVVICNGVYGYGLNLEDDVNKAFKATYRVLRKDGLFIFGWNNCKERSPYDIENTQAFQLFKKFYFEPLKVDKYEVNTHNGHTFNFFITDK